MHRENEILNWAYARNLIGPTGEATRQGQVCKTFEEVCELLDAINKGDVEAAKDAIGDVMVTLIIQASMWRLSPDDCIEAAWQAIKDRRGVMRGGVFVKEAV